MIRKDDSEESVPEPLGAVAVSAPGTLAAKKILERGLLVQISEMHQHHHAALVRLSKTSAEFTTAPWDGDASDLLQRWQTGVLEGLIVRASTDKIELGLVGAMLFARLDGALRVESFMLDPRAMGHQVERQMLTVLGVIAQCRDLARLSIRYHSNGRNAAAEKFLFDLQGERVSLNETSSLYFFPTLQIANLGLSPAGETPAGFVARTPLAPK